MLTARRSAQCGNSRSRTVAWQLHNSLERKWHSAAGTALLAMSPAEAAQLELKGIVGLRLQLLCAQLHALGAAAAPGGGCLGPASPWPPGCCWPGCRLWCRGACSILPAEVRLLWGRTTWAD